MRQPAEPDNPAPKRPTTVAVGVFDGVHRGHQALLKMMIAAAGARGLATTVVTFFPHPRVVLHGDSGRIYLTSIEDRLHLLKQMGIDEVIIYPFNRETQHLRAADFVGELVERLDMKQIWSGDFGLGYQREGTAEFLRPLGAKMGFSVHEYPVKFEIHGRQVSSSRIREGLSGGNMEDINACLGRPYRLSGTVVAGARRGRQIGFPTANLDIWEQLILPANGVYAAIATVDNRRYAAATNIGVRPTVDGHNLLVEPHLLDFSGDIYGARMTLEFVTRIRPEMKFGDLEALKSQIAADVEQVRQILL